MPDRPAAPTDDVPQHLDDAHPPIEGHAEPREGSLDGGVPHPSEPRARGVSLCLHRAQPDFGKIRPGFCREGDAWLRYCEANGTDLACGECDQRPDVVPDVSREEKRGNPDKKAGECLALGMLCEVGRSWRRYYEEYGLWPAGGRVCHRCGLACGSVFDLSYGTRVAKTPADQVARERRPYNPFTPIHRGGGDYVGERSRALGEKFSVENGGEKIPGDLNDCQAERVAESQREAVWRRTVSEIKDDVVRGGWTPDLVEEYRALMAQRYPPPVVKAGAVDDSLLRYAAGGWKDMEKEEGVMEDRLASIRRRYEGLSGDMPPHGDVLFLLRVIEAMERWHGAGGSAPTWNGRPDQVTISGGRVWVHAKTPDGLKWAWREAKRQFAHIGAMCGHPNTVEACRLNVGVAKRAQTAIDAALAKAEERG